jgi:hypothetical protein
MDTRTQLSSIAELLADFAHPWGFAGGWAVDLFLDHETRSHKDVDVAILRRDQLDLQSLLRERGWDLRVAHGERWVPWRASETLALPLHCIWCTHATFAPDFLEVLLNEASETHFLFRRDATICLGLDAAFLRSPSGLPVLAPEVVLLYKAKYAAEEPHRADFHRLLPHLGPRRQAWLATALEKLHQDHAWLRELAGSRLRGGGVA